MEATGNHGSDERLAELAGRITFRPLRAQDREPLLAIAARIWEGHDYLPFVFDAWVAHPDAYFAGMFLDGRLVGCGRLLPLSARVVWLEALRVDSDYRGRGLGREMSAHIARTARERGFEIFYFSTYFENRGSISISEAAGFRRIATYSHLELEDLDRASAALADVPRDSVTVTPGIPDVSEMLTTDWFFVPPEAENRSQHFPGAVTISDGDCRALLVPNSKYPVMLEIGWCNAPAGKISRPCLAYAVDHARRLGLSAMHTMAPASQAVEPYTEIGFVSFEQEQDVYLYAARANELKV
jgi:GNAT superfamily N-acetyltransferase